MNLSFLSYLIIFFFFFKTDHFRKAFFESFVTKLFMISLNHFCSERSVFIHWFYKAFPILNNQFLLLGFSYLWIVSTFEMACSFYILIYLVSFFNEEFSIIKKEEHVYHSCVWKIIGLLVNNHVLNFNRLLKLLFSGKMENILLVGCILSLLRLL